MQTFNRFIVRSLDWGIKLASLAVTGPATWQVSGELFRDISSPLILLLMRLSAVFLVEGVLLSNWLLLEFDKQVNELVKARYGLTALAMYGALLVIAWAHEGPIGLVFRGALLAALIGSGWDTYVYTWQRMTASVDRSPENSGKVKRAARNLAQLEAIEARKAESRVTLKIIELNEAAQLQRIALEHQRIATGLQIEHRAGLREIKANDSDQSGAKRGNLTYPVQRINADRKAQKEQRQQLIQSMLSLQPESKPSEIVTVLQRETGISESTGWSDWRDYLQAEKVIESNGNGNGHHREVSSNESL